MKHLGEYMDIHCGGVDNIFPHHTNEIAQSEAYLGHKWCNYWFHIHHLNDKSGKMSKSNGEFLTVSLLQEKGYDPLVYRLFCLQSHYRKPLEFSYEVMDNMTVTYNKLVKKIAELTSDGEVSEEGFNKYREDFEAALSNDINTSSAITVIYDVLRSDLNNSTKLALIESFDEVLSLNLTRGLNEQAEEIDSELVEYINAKIEERKAAKKEKDFAKADAIRAELMEKGIAIKDTREGTVWEIVNV
jgi:cysteinyl-tRNA synthetase